MLVLELTRSKKRASASDRDQSFAEAHSGFFSFHRTHGSITRIHSRGTPRAVRRGNIRRVNWPGARDHEHLHGREFVLRTRLSVCKTETWLWSVDPLDGPSGSIHGMCLRSELLHM